MAVPRFALTMLAVGLGPIQGWAQEGPSFDCRYAGTATEVAICTDPALARAEMRMFGAYEGLVEALGARPARRIADRLLEQRQACGGERACVAQQLALAERVFARRADRALGRETGVLPDVLAVVPRPPLRPEPALPAAAAAPTSEEIAAALATAQPVSSDAAPEPSTVAPVSSDAALKPSTVAPVEGTPASFDSPSAWAFMDLVRHQRAEIQARLAEAGLYDGPGEGSWDQATLSAIEAFGASPQGQGFDLATVTGAKLALDFIRSDAFAPDDPLAAAEW